MSARSLCFALVPLSTLLLMHGVSSADASQGFDRDAAMQALGGVDLASCKGKHRAKQGGDGHVAITFDPGGKASDVVVDRGPFVATPVAKCIARKFQKVTVPPFDGMAVRVGKNFHID